MSRTNGPHVLDLIAETALDDDYYVYRERRPNWWGALAVALTLAVVGLVAAPAAVQARHQSAGAALERATLVRNVKEQQSVQARGQAILAQLRFDVATLEREQGLAPTDTHKLAALTGAVAVSGPGVTTLIDNGPGADGVVTDTDLQLLVNGLWYAGAEAVSVDGERVGTLTSIRGAGDAITVNYRSIRAPYDVIAIGDADTIVPRFTQSPTGRYWELRHRRARIGFGMTGSSNVTVPAVDARRLVVSHAQVRWTSASGEGEGQ